jgi:glycosyl transferase family 25
VRAYVINLARSPERRAHVVAGLNRAGLDYEIVEAVDGRELDLTDSRIVNPTEPDQMFSPLWATTWALPGVAGCALSHLLVCQRILERGDSRALVLEDDVLLPRDLGVITDALDGQLVGAEVALLNFDSREPCRMSRQGAQSLPQSRLLVLPLDVCQPLSAAAYVITREACLRMADKMFPARAKPDDWGFFYQHGVLDRVRCVVPMPVEKSPNFESTILYDPGSTRARLRAAVMRSRAPLLRQAIAIRRRRIFRQWTQTELVDAPFIEKPSRLGQLNVEGAQRD